MDETLDFPFISMDKAVEICDVVNVTYGFNMKDMKHFSRND